MSGFVDERGRDMVRCECCVAFATFDNAVKGGWDWFTGWLPKTVHYCAKHKNSAERDVMFVKSREPQR